MSEKPLPSVRITYCTQCQWLLRAGWMAQELLSTFGTDLGEVTLVPGTGGIFTISCNDVLVWDRKRDGGFPDAAKLKQLVRDVIDPDRDLGHGRHPGGARPRSGPARMTGGREPAAARRIHVRATSSPPCLICPHARRRRHRGEG